MRRLSLSSAFVLALSLGSLPFPSARTHAQDAASPRAGSAPPSSTSPGDDPAASPVEPGAPAPAEDASTSTPTAAPPEDGDEADAPRVLEPPNLPALDVGKGGSAALPEPADDADRLAASAPPPAEKRGWSLPETVFQLHGYMRLRGTFLKDGALGHRPWFDRLPVGEGNVRNTNYDPFPFFRPDDSTNAAATGTNIGAVQGGCGDGRRDGNGSCSKRGQVSGDLRLRLKPEIHLSDDVRVKAWVDVLDNVGLGTLGYGPSYAPNKASGDSAIRARRVWGEARNRDIGELRFGRMGADWGLGILDNGGDRYGIDSDFSSEVDRLMGITNLAGFYIMAAYDWASEGKVLGKTQTPSGVPLDAAQKDDLDAFTFSVARKLDEAAQQGALARGDAVFNYGVYFIYRKQLLRYRDLGSFDASADATVDTRAGRYERLNQKQFVPDLWVQLLWEGLRVEVEAAFVAGKLEGGCPRLNGTTLREAKEARSVDDGGRAPNGSCKFRQLGIALELEYRLFDERLGLHLNVGGASGDRDAYGLSASNDPSLQRADGDSAAADRTISTFGFHPDYRIDLILWRTVMRRVAGAYYARPGVSYDFIRDPYGQLAGGRLDVVYSRAAAARQTWGDNPNLGLELDLSLYYRSEDGPDPMDGFYGLVQWGVLFPFKGLGYGDLDGAPGKKNAMVLRGVAGIAF